MTINELVKKDLLKKVRVQKPPDVITEAGQQKVTTEFRNRNWNRLDISICLVEVMRERRKMIRGSHQALH